MAARATILNRWGKTWGDENHPVLRSVLSYTHNLSIFHDSDENHPVLRSVLSSQIWVIFITPGKTRWEGQK